LDNVYAGVDMEYVKNRLRSKFNKMNKRSVSSNKVKEEMHWLQAVSSLKDNVITVVNTDIRVPIVEVRSLMQTKALLKALISLSNLIVMVNQSLMVNVTTVESLVIRLQTVSRRRMQRKVVLRQRMERFRTSQSLIRVTYAWLFNNAH
jgi:hypothetical protein